MRDPEALILEFVELVQEWCGSSFQYSGPASEEEIEAAERELGLVFPSSYRAFLRHFGSGTTPYPIFGLPGDRLWGDVVMMNQLALDWTPASLIRFTDPMGDYTYFLDMSRMDDEGECPVIVFGPGEDGAVVADNFLDFLRKAGAGLL